MDYGGTRGKLLTVLCLFMLYTGCAAADQAQTQPSPSPDKIQMTVFYDGLCSSCDKLSEFYDLLSEELEGVKELYPYEVIAHNAYATGGAEAQAALLETLGINKNAQKLLSLPLLIIDGKIYPGQDAIKESVREAYLTAGEDFFVYHKPPFDPTKPEDLQTLLAAYPIDADHSTVVYFYRANCVSCAQVSGAVLPALPETLEINGKQTPLDIIKINVFSGQNAEILRAFSHAYRVPENEQKVPMVFLAGEYFSGLENIKEGLYPALEKGGGLGFKMPEQ